MTAFLVPSEGSARRGRLTKSHFADARRSLPNIPNIPSTSFRHPEQQQQSLHALNAFSQGQALTSAALVTADANAQVFEPVMPDTSGLVAMGGVVVLCVIAALVWNNSVVPISRTKLAISKSRGEVKEYLDGLEEGAAATTTDTSSSGDISENVDTSMKSNSADDMSEDVETSMQSNSADAADSDGRDFERWLFTDWLEGRKGGSKAGRQKEPALPILKSAKWNSGDNPVVVTSALMFLGVVIASLTERAGSMM